MLNGGRNWPNWPESSRLKTEKALGRVYTLRPASKTTASKTTASKTTASETTASETTARQLHPPLSRQSVSKDGTNVRKQVPRTVLHTRPYLAGQSRPLCRSSPTSETSLPQARFEDQRTRAPNLFR